MNSRTLKIGTTENIVTDYHIIGDIHGHADMLEQLLRNLGYQKEEGIYKHSDAKVVFLGDFIDRGPHQRRVIDIVKPMVVAGSALAVMGNHEFNAICYHTLHPETADPLRPHDEHNTKQHKAFLKEYALHDEETLEVINWFKKLPIYLEVKNAKGDQVLFRAIHACWSQAIIDRIPQHLDKNYILEASTKDSEAYNDIEVLLKGPEMPLPEDSSFMDSNGTVRNNIRIKWWSTSNNSTYREIAMVPQGEEKNIPAELIPTGKDSYSYRKDAAPVFFGHYWLTGKPGIIRNNLACLDYSAGTRGELVAYHWKAQTSGETLNNSAFIYKFSDVPVDEDTVVILETRATLGQYEVLYQAWVWSGIRAESIIFLSEEVSDLDDEELKEFVSESPLVKSESQLTVNDRSGKYTFVNFNFEDTSDDGFTGSWTDNRTDQEKKIDRESTVRFIGQWNKAELDKIKKLRNEKP